MSLANFLMVGAPKCGSTSIYHYLKAHPNIFMPEIKEPYYLIQPRSVIGRGPGSLGQGLIETPDRYHLLFSGADQQVHQAIGEATAGYLFMYPYAIQMIKETLGDPRIIIVLRDPAERSFSSHVNHLLSGLEPLSFEEALNHEETRRDNNWWFGYQLAAVSCYADQVEAYLDSFSRVHICFYDDLQDDPVGFMQSIYRFLEVEEKYLPDTRHKHNQSFVPRSHWLHALLQNKKLFNKTLSRLHLSQMVFKKPFEKILIAIDSLNSYCPQLNDNLRKELNRSLFNKDIHRLQKITNRNLSHWL